MKRFLRNSFICLIATCIIVFIWLTLFMSRQTKKTITEVSEVYMSELNTQLQQKFSSIIGLRLQQVEGIIRLYPPENAEYGEQMIDDLTANAKARGFSYLGFYSDDYDLETIYGNHLTISNEDRILESLNENGTIIAQALNDNDEKFLILGKKADYPMKNEKTSAALIVGVPMEYLNETLFLSSDHAIAYSHIIDNDGNFVIRNGDAFRDSYFDRIRFAFDELNGKNAEQYISELKESIKERTDYSTVISINGSQRHIYCSPLSENSTWYLITVMPDGTLNSMITELDSVRLGIIIGSVVILLIAMSVIFSLYYRLSQQQMKELDLAKQEAVRANMAKSEFLSSMSHDIRTPMNAIIGMTEIASKNTSDPVRIEDCLSKIKLSSKHLLGLINDVLDMSKIESGKVVLNINPMSLREAMDDIVNIMRPQIKNRQQSFDIFIRNIITEDVDCDSIRLNQVLLNLLSNAVKFTPEKGRIDVYLYQEPSPLGDEYVRTHFRVEDTGIGMSEDFQKKIFDTFARENTEQVQNITGTGLGMAISKHIIDLMGGTIELQSSLGQGSQFHVILDLKKSDAENETHMKLPEWNILVVDDNEQLCSSAVSNLEELGVHASWTLDGKKAVEMIAERHERKDDYHFVLIDWKMPHMDGIQTVREIRNIVGKDIPVFLISAYDWSDIEEEARAWEIEGFISKPLFKSTLYSRLKQYADNDKLADNEDGEPHEINLTGKHILLAEDIDINWEIANEIFSAIGLTLERAVNGLECVEKFEQSEIGFYDAILMDIRMPVMNGYDATKTIRALNRPDNKLPIIAMTADAFSDDAQRCIACGMNAHLAKPLDIKECMRTLQKYLS